MPKILTFIMPKIFTFRGVTFESSNLDQNHLEIVGLVCFIYLQTMVLWSRESRDRAYYHLTKSTPTGHTMWTTSPANPESYPGANCIFFNEGYMADITKNYTFNELVELLDILGPKEMLEFI